MSIIFITGGNTGLGFESARRLIALGHKVYIDCRNEEKGKKAASSIDAHYINIDVSDDDSVRKALQEFKEKEDHLDVLINNAGIPGGRIVAKDMKAEIMQEIYNVNVFGIVRVIHECIPLL